MRVSPAGSRIRARRRSSWAGSLDALDNRGAYALQARRARDDRVDARSPARRRRRDCTSPKASPISTNCAGTQGKITTHGAFAGIPLDALTQLAGVKSPLASTMVIAGDWSLAASPQLNGTLHVRRERGDLFGTESVSPDASGFGARHHDARSRRAVRRRQRQGHRHAALAARRQRRRHAVSISGRVRRTPRAASRFNAPMTATLVADLPSLRAAAAVAGHAGRHRRPRALDVDGAAERWPTPCSPARSAPMPSASTCRSTACIGRTAACARISPTIRSSWKTCRSPAATANSQHRERSRARRARRREIRAGGARNVEGRQVSRRQPPGPAARRRRQRHAGGREQQACRPRQRAHRRTAASTTSRRAWARSATTSSSRAARAMPTTRRRRSTCRWCSISTSRSAIRLRFAGEGLDTRLAGNLRVATERERRARHATARSAR